MRCGAKKRNGDRCQQWPVKGRRRCRLHGGKTPLGASAGRYIHGRYSKFLPARLFAAYQDAAHDPQLLELRRDIALTDARIVDLLERVDSGESGAIWRAAQAAMAQFRRAQTQGDVEAMPRALGQVDQRLTQGHADYAAWDEVLALIAQRRKLVESEQKRVTRATEVLTVERAMTMLAQVVGIIERHVSDRGILQRIALDMQALGHHAGNGQGWHVDKACEGRQTA
jgi:hypothetical protein